MEKQNPDFRPEAISAQTEIAPVSAKPEVAKVTKESPQVLDAAILPEELEVSLPIASATVEQSTPRPVEDPIGGAKALWQDVHDGQEIFSTLPFRRATDVLTGLKRAAMRQQMNN